MAEKRLCIIDFLKGLSALIIMIYHYRHIVVYSGLPNASMSLPLENIFNLIYRYGYLCVELFFFLSGFGMAINYLDCRLSPLTFKDFIVPKIKKLYPAYFITTFIVVIIQYFSLMTQGSMLLGLKNYTFVDVVLNVFMVGTGIFATRVPFNVPAWFLTPLIVCYCLFYFIIRQHKEERIYGCIILMLIGAVCLYNKWMEPIFNERMARGIFSFFLGSCIYFFVYKNKEYFDRRDKCFLLIITFFSCFLLKIAGSGVIYISSIIIFSLVFSCIILSEMIEKRIFMKIEILYKPLQRLSYQIFLSHYVILTLMAFIAKKYSCYQLFYDIKVFFIYVCLTFMFSIFLCKVTKINKF